MQRLYVIYLLNFVPILSEYFFVPILSESFFEFRIFFTPGYVSFPGIPAYAEDLRLRAAQQHHFLRRAIRELRAIAVAAQVHLQQKFRAAVLALFENAPEDVGGLRI